MGLFKKREKPVYEKATFEVTMTPSGKIQEGEQEVTFRLVEDVEFLAVLDAEKKYPKLKVARVVEIKDE